MTNTYSISAMEQLPVGDGLSVAGHAVTDHSQRSTSAPPDSVVLVGRDRERVFLREELKTAMRGQGRLVILGGEAGIGKTTLARDLAAEAAARGALVLTGHCYDLTNTPPYGPWLDLFADYPVSGEPEPPAAFTGGRLQGTITDQGALFEAVRAFFADLTANRPAVVILEDLHWTDPASVELLRYLGARLGRMPLLLVVTYRIDELTLRHPFARQLPALIRDSGGLRLDLKRLQSSDLGVLVAAQFALEPADAIRLVRYLTEHSEGNPFFATELLRALREVLLLHPENDRWRLGELDRLVLPALVKQVIESRIAGLGEEMRGPLSIAAVIGQEIPLDLWAEVAGLDDEALFAIVERAVDAHLMEAERLGTRVRFVHALTREALYEGVLPPRRRIWHRQIADALAAEANADPDAVASHLERAGDPRAPEWLIRAGDRAQRAYALITAAERFRAAAALLEGMPGEERQRSLLLYRSARLMRFSYPTSGKPDMEEAERLAMAAGDAMLAAEARYSVGLLDIYADDFAAGIHDTDVGISALEALPHDLAEGVDAVEVWLSDSLPSHGAGSPAPADMGTNPFWVNGVHHRRGGNTVFMTLSGRLAEAQPIAETFTAGIEPDQLLGSLIDPSLGHAWVGLGANYAAQGRVRDGRAAFARARERYRTIDHHAMILISELIQLRDLELPYAADDPPARHRLAAEAEAALRRAGGALQPGILPRMTSLACLVLDGQWDTACEVLNELPQLEHYILRREVTTTVATIARHRGNPAAAWAVIGGVLTDGPQAEPGSEIHQEALFLQRLAADLALDAGELPKAQSWLAAHDRWLDWSGAVLGRADGRLAWARYFQMVGDRNRALAAAAEALTLAAEPRQPLVLLAAHRLLGTLAGDAGRRSDAERHLGSALDLADACAAPFERALTLLALAEARSRLRDAGDVSRLLDEVLIICRQLRAVPTLARAEDLARQSAQPAPSDSLPFGLTVREGEVLRLVSEGLTDVAVAERLFISPRTVQQHLRSVYGKMGVSSRAAATRSALEHGLV